MDLLWTTCRQKPTRRPAKPSEYSKTRRRKKRKNSKRRVNAITMMLRSASIGMTMKRNEPCSLLSLRVRPKLKQQALRLTQPKKKEPHLATKPSLSNHHNRKVHSDQFSIHVFK